MRQVIGKAKQLNTDRVGLTQKHSTTTYQLAKTLTEIAEGQYAEITLGLGFRVFVTQFRDDNGAPRTYTWATGLMTQLRKIQKHKPLVSILERQSPDSSMGFVSFSSAFYAAKLAEEENWQAIATKTLRDAECPADEWQKAKASFLIKRYHHWGIKSTRAIKDRIKELRNDKEDEELPSSWPYHGGRVDPDVKNKYDIALEMLAGLVRGDTSIHTLSYVQEMETIGEGVCDVFEALDKAVKGDSKQLQGIMEQLAGEK